MFKVGDKVKCTEHTGTLLAYGAEYTIARFGFNNGNAEGYQWLVLEGHETDRDDNIWDYRSDRFELVKEKQMKFKVGDKVRPNNETQGDGYFTIRAVGDEEILLEGSRDWQLAGDFKLYVPTAVPTTPVVPPEGNAPQWKLYEAVKQLKGAIKMLEEVKRNGLGALQVRGVLAIDKAYDALGTAERLAAAYVPEAPSNKEE